MRLPAVIPAAAAAALALPAAWATTTFNGNTAPSGAHYANGAVEPRCTLDTSTDTVSCTGTAISGVGNIDGNLYLSLSASATVQCRNNGGKIVDVKTQVTTSGNFNNATNVRNGTLYVDPISIGAPGTQGFLNAASCPNGNWDKLMDGPPTVTSYTYTLTFVGFLDPAIVETGP